MSKQVVLISHGKLSAGVADAVAMVFGKNEELSSMGLVLSILAMPGELSQAQIDQAVADAQAGTKVVEFIKADAPVDNGEDDFF